MKLAYFPNQCALNSRPVMDAFLTSCEAAGAAVVTNSMSADAAVIWSQLWAGRMRGNRDVWDHYRSQGKPIIVLEVGALKRNVTWRVMLNGKHCPLQSQNNSHRADSLGLSAQPWRLGGEHILIALQRNDSNLWQGMAPTSQWVQQTVAALQSVTDKKIVVRSHPRQPIRLPGIQVQQPVSIPGTYDDFDFVQSLENVYAVINHNSSSAVQAILNGIPAVVSTTSIAAPVAATDLSCINNLIRPDRQQWINDLAWSEWTVEEIAQGIPLQLLNISKTSI